MAEPEGPVAAYPHAIWSFGLNFACDDLLNEVLATDYRSRRYGCVLRGGCSNGSQLASPATLDLGLERRMRDITPSIDTYLKRS